MDALTALLETLTPAQREVVEKAAAQIKRLEIEHEHQRLLILDLRRARYGAKGEKLSSLQLDLLDLEPGGSVKEVEAEAALGDPEASLQEEAEEGAETKTAPKKRYGKPHPGRGGLPARRREWSGCWNARPRNAAVVSAARRSS